MEHARQFDIVDEAGAASEERRVFYPRYSRAKLPCPHGPAPDGSSALEHLPSAVIPLNGWCRTYSVRN